MKHNVLIILPWLPYPLNTGGNQATFNCIEALKNDLQFHIACPFPVMFWGIICGRAKK